MSKRSFFCDFRSYKCVYQVWSWLVIQLGDKSYDGEHLSCNRVVEMFTASTTDVTKERILNDFRAGRVRVVVATVAFGLGVSYFHKDYNSLRHFFLYKTNIYLVNKVSLIPFCSIMSIPYTLNFYIVQSSF